MNVKTVIDPAALYANRARARRMNLDGADFLLQRALDDLALRLDAVTRHFKRAVCTGAHGQAVADWLVAKGFVQSARALEICHGENGHEFLYSDDEPIRGEFDLAISLLDLHESNDTPGLMVQHRHLLTPDGLFLACLPGAGTLGELRDSLLSAEVTISGGAAARILPFMDVRDAGALLQRAGFALPVADLDAVTVRYDTMFDLISDLRAMGATNSLVDRPRGIPARHIFLAAAQIYHERYSDDDERVRATFNLVWLSAWSPAESQPKPLRPGSATHSLAQALKDRSEN